MYDYLIYYYLTHSRQAGMLISRPEKSSCEEDALTTDAQNDKRPTSPGEYLRDQLQARGWTQADLARIVGRPLPTINGIVQGKHAIMPEMAIALGLVFGDGPEMWMQRESAYRLSLAKGDEGDSIRKRARFYNLAPIKDIQKRGWIKQTNDMQDLEQELLSFFGIKSIDDEPSMIVSLRKTSPDEPLNKSQLAWCFRVRALTSSQIVAPFDPQKIDESIGKLRKLAAFAPEARKTAKLLNDYGIRFVIVEPLPGTKMDGAAFWIDDDKAKPAIALSVRYDRIDAFWYTLFHEMSHIRHEDALSIDVALVGDDATPSLVKSAIERRADREAAETLIPADKLDSFIHRVAPLYSKERIIQFAHLLKIHPGIIVGQLQHRGQIGFHANRDLLVKVRSIAASTAIVDGWGNTIS